MNKICNYLEFLKALGFRQIPCSTTIKETKNISIEEINKEIRECKKCELHKTRKTPVCGQGSIDSELMFVGEAPGYEEDLEGKPFIGEAGKLLSRLIEKMGFRREDVYITNAVKCHPPLNRDPSEEEIKSCLNYLQKEIELISPKVIMALGKVATYALLGTKGKLKDLQISKVRGKVFYFNKIPVIPTFHPAYLLRNRKDKWLTWQDAQEALRRLK
ncbi:MAG: uracil-DNA glycosylase [Thermodesulfovibrionaceae bacterium]